MLVNNMESVFKIFFRGMGTVRVKHGVDGLADEETESLPTKRIEFNLKKLEAQRIVATRTRPDTRVK